MKIQQLESGKFRSQIRDPLNKKARLNITGDSPAEVIARAERMRVIRRDVRAGLGDTREHYAHVRALVEGPYTVRRAWEDAIKRKGPREQRNYGPYWRNHFEHVFGDATLSQATDEMLSRWETFMAKRAARSTIKTYFAMLRSAVRKHVPHRIPELPWGSWKPAGLGRESAGRRAILKTIDDVRAVVLACRQLDQRSRHRGGHLGDFERRILVLVLTGLRNGELGGLGWDDLDLRVRRDAEGRITLSGVMTVRHQVKKDWHKDHPDWTRPLDPPKNVKRKRSNGGPAVQVLHPDAVGALLAQQEAVRARGWYRDDGPVFPNERTGSWRTDEETVKPSKLREAAILSGVKVDLDRFVPHSLRHSFASLEIAAHMRAGNSLQDVAERTRHSDLRALMVYVHELGEGLTAPGMATLALPERTEPAPSDFTHPRLADQPELAPPACVEMMTAPEADVFEAEEVEMLVRGAQGYCRGNWEPAYRAWVLAGRPGKRPQEVTADFNRAYVKAYVRALREGLTKAEAKNAGMRGKRGTQMAWGKWLRAFELAAGSKGSALAKIAPAPVEVQHGKRKAK